MFQVIADRAEKSGEDRDYNLPFSDRSQVIPNPQPCRTLLDRLTDQARIIATGADSSVPPHHGTAQGQQYDGRERSDADPLRPVSPA